MPLWSDIFDGKIVERVAIAKQVMEKSECVGLLDKGVGIRPRMSKRCEARELVKYAAFLDACITGSHRFFKMSSRALKNDRTQNVYEYGLKSIEKRWPSLIHQRIAIKRFVTANLRAAWVSSMCGDAENRPMVAIGREASEHKTPLDEYGHPPPLDRKGVPVFIKKTHDNLLKIAAKSGDEWALISYYPSYESVEYLNDLYKFKPILVHRYLASPFGHRLADEEQLQHQIKAYLMLKEEHPDNEKLNWDLTTHPLLLASWEHVRDGKALNFPWR